MATELSLDELRKMVSRAGLKLAEEELQKLLPGVNRSRNQAAELRQLMADPLEPAGTFSANARKQKY
ncbi:MAG TPA: hypothetical protein VFU31_16045 [Candidatus Binatia bacterium]|nr:hypothetical protein [Candidatus Binatia bacterium]